MVDLIFKLVCNNRFFCNLQYAIRILQQIEGSDSRVDSSDSSRYCWWFELDIQEHYKIQALLEAIIMRQSRNKREES